MANTGSDSPVRARKSERTGESSLGGAQTAPPRQSTDISTASEGAADFPAPTFSQDRESSVPGAQQSQAASPGNGIAEKLREQAKSRLSSQKDRALDGVGGVTEAIRQTTQSLRDKQHDTVARYVEQATEQLDRLTRRLKEKDIGELLEDAQQLARRQPAMFVGAAFALGLFGARFFKSSPPDRRGDFESISARETGAAWRTSQSATEYGSYERPTSARR